jgi:hypothetical protein
MGYLTAFPLRKGGKGVVSLAVQDSGLDTSRTDRASVNAPVHAAMMCAGKAEAQIVVPVVRGVVVAVGCANVPRIVVPAAAAIHPVGAALRPLPFSVNSLFLKFSESANPM